jgi:hypothetical protein
MEKMSTHPRRWPVVAAACWSLVWLAAAFSYHINEPVGVLGITLNGHTYTGSPPALTLFERDRFPLILGTVIVVAALTVSAIDVALRSRRKDSRAGVPSLVVGLSLAAFSLFGLLWGLLSVGIVGAFLVLASRPPKSIVKA